MVLEENDRLNATLQVQLDSNSLKETEMKIRNVLKENEALGDEVEVYKKEV